MAEVVRCDVCGCVEQPHQTKYVKLGATRTLEVFNVTFENRVCDRPIVKKDICSQCYAKLMRFLGGDTSAI